MAFLRITFCFRIILLLNEIVTAKISIETYFGNCYNVYHA